MKEDTGILVVDDEFSVRDSLHKWFKSDGFRVETAEDALEALKKLESGAWDIVLVDIKMPGMDGMELQRRIRKINDNISTIMITAYATVETAVQAMKEGASDYITKPFDPDELSMLINRVLREKDLLSENIRLRTKIDRLVGHDEIVGESAAMKKVMEMVETVAKTEATVLIRGESGTGKELIAKAIHANSPRRYFPIIPINCGALPETLLESELFGHERGAFTGAQYRRKGKLEMADGGTLFLDEIGNISMKTQLDLLSVLETKEFARIGGNQVIRVDFRVICATNADLEQAVKEGHFREDLYYRVNVFTIYLPPLRENRSDIPMLAEHFLKKYALSMNKRVDKISPEAMDLLVRYNWPGNVRELENAVERAMVVAKGDVITEEDLPFQLKSEFLSPASDSLEEVEKAHIINVLNKMDWNITRSAQLLKVDRQTLYNKIKKYGIQQ